MSIRDTTQLEEFAGPIAAHLPAELKPMPLASVIYAVTFAEAGQPTVQGAIHADTAGRFLFQGDAAKTLVMLQAAMETTAKRFSGSITEQLTRAIEEKRLLNAELHTPTES